MLRIVLALWLFALPAIAAETVVADMNQKNVSITATFDGSHILIYGAVKRDAPAPEESKIDVVIEVSGPPEPVTVRRKERKFGIWVNAASVEVEHAPTFYAIAATGPLDEILTDADDARLKISVDHLIELAEQGDSALDGDTFADAVIRIRQDKDLYTATPGTVVVTDDTLFKTQIDLPSNLTEGDYLTRIFLLRNKTVLDVFETQISVRKVGLERWIYNLAHQKPLIYGLLSLAIAIFAGWAASTIFRLLRLN